MKRLFVCLLLVGVVGCGESQSPIAGGNEASRVFTHEELCFFLKDNIESRNDSLQGKVIAVAFETRAFAVYHGDQLDSNCGVSDDVKLYVHISPNHVDEMLTGRFPEFQHQDGTPEGDLRIVRPEGVWYGFLRGKIIRGETQTDLWEMGVPRPTFRPDGTVKTSHTSLGSPIFSIRVRGICDISTSTYSSGESRVIVHLKRCRIENAELTRIDGTLASNDLPPKPF
jgi:hypothetical protein